MSTDDHTRFADDAGAYLLGALDPDERAAFEQHLAGCPDCRREVEALQVAVDALPRSVEQMAAPESLKASLMETVRADARQRAPERRPRWRGFLLARPAFAAAAAALFVAVGIGAGVLVGGLGGGDDRRVHAAQIDTERLPGGRAELVVDDGGAILRVEGMQRPPEDHVYEVWLRRGNRVERSSLFTVARDGSGSAGIPEGLKGVDQVMVTREPDGGSDTPSEPPVLTVDL